MRLELLQYQLGLVVPPFLAMFPLYHVQLPFYALLVPLALRRPGERTRFVAARAETLLHNLLFLEHLEGGRLHGRGLRHIALSPQSRLDVLIFRRTRVVVLVLEVALPGFSCEHRMYYNLYIPTVSLAGRFGCKN